MASLMRWMKANTQMGYKLPGENPSEWDTKGDFFTPDGVLTVRAFGQERFMSWIISEIVRVMYPFLSELVYRLFWAKSRADFEAIRKVS